MDSDIEVTIHNIDLSGFIGLLPIMYRSTEWIQDDRCYMSGDIRIKNLNISVFSEDYEKPLRVAKETEDQRLKDAGKEGE